LHSFVGLPSFLPFMLRRGVAFLGLAIFSVVSEGGE